MKVSLSEAQGLSLIQDRAFPRITFVDPYGKTVIIDFGQAVASLMWDEIKKGYGIEISLTPEEMEMVERGRLTHQVEKAARALKASIDAWLLKENAR